MYFGVRFSVPKMGNWLLNSWP